MIRPSISRQSGEWDTKLKDKLRFLGKAAALILVAVGCFCGLFYFADTVFDRAVGDLFEELFMTDIKKWGVTVTKLDWSTLKKAALIICAIIVSLWTLSILVAVSVTRKKTVRASAARAGKLLRQYFSSEEQDDSLFPEEYWELSTCASDLKKQIRHNEMELKDEASKKNDLIAYLAHDLKTPLTSVVGYLSLMEEAPEMAAEQKAKFVHIALDKALRLEQLINEFFEITRYNLKEITLEKEKIDLGYMLVQMADEFYPLVVERGNTIEVNVGDELMVTADANKIARVFNNILKNAVAYSDPQTPITIHASRRMGLIRIAFSNQGKTIPRQKLQSIFEKFYRMDEARSSNTGGAGLGLAIAKEIVSLHGGTITAESQDQSTVFTVLLPAK